MTSRHLSRPEAAAEADARTASQYDAVPYVSIPFPKLHIGRLCATARLFGHPAPDPRTARVLEIGCASGGHLIPLAAAMPNAEFLGVDVSGIQIAQGRARIARLGLRNIRLQACSFTDLPADAPRFDYIICHGVFSWITAELREALMACCQALLQPFGVAAISYNVLPGWRVFQVVRDSVILHAGGLSDLAERMAETRRLLRILVDSANPKSPYSLALSSAAAKMLPMPDAYLAHELFEENNTPLTFAEFNGIALRHGLGHLADTQLWASIPESMDAERAALVRDLAHENFYAAEQYLDVLTGRTFRSSILIRTEALAATDRELPLERFANLHFIGPLGLRIRPRAEGGWMLSDAEEETVAEIGDERVAAVAQSLLRRMPASVSTDDLTAVAAARGLDQSDLLEVMRALVCEGLLEVSTEPVPCAPAGTASTAAWSLARADAAARLDYTATRRHAAWQITAQDRLLLPLLDGTRDREALVQALFDAAVAQDATLMEGGVPVTDPSRIRDFCRLTVERGLARYAEGGLLID